jgi:hypothetical protein
VHNRPGQHLQGGGVQDAEASAWVATNDELHLVTSSPAIPEREPLTMPDWRVKGDPEGGQASSFFRRACYKP